MTDATHTLWTSGLLYDWNAQDATQLSLRRSKLLDETLRDGLQGASVREPTLEQKADLMRRSAALGVEHINIGYPGAGPRAYAHASALAEIALAEKLPARLACAARTHPADIGPILRICERTSAAIEVMAFLGASSLRCRVERWSDDTLRQRVRDAVSWVRAEGMPCTLVLEDSTRTPPQTLRDLWSVAADAGVSGLCLCDTVGHATPTGTRALVGFARQQIAELGGELSLDWHGHNDRGLALANSIAAAAAGADRVHGCLLGVGERVGNAPLDLLLLNRRLDGYDVDLRALRGLVGAACSALGAPLPSNYPAFGRDAFRTATGVHAAAIRKARERGDAEAVDLIYSSVPASWVGREQCIEIGPMSGAANVHAWMQTRGVAAGSRAVARVLARAKQASRVLDDAEISALLCGGEGEQA